MKVLIKPRRIEKEVDGGLLPNPVNNTKWPEEVPTGPSIQIHLPIIIKPCQTTDKGK